MMKLKWYWVLLIAIVIVLIVIVIYNNSTASAPKKNIVNPVISRPPLIILNRNTQDDNPNSIIAAATFEDPMALTDSKGQKATLMGDHYVLNGLTVIKCCNARSASTCKCTGWTWQPKDNCTDPGCGGSGAV